VDEACPGSGTETSQHRPRDVDTPDWTHRQGALAEDDDVHVERLEVRLGVRVLVERSETDKIVIPEQLNLLSSLL
jgi:hypothetical protein